MRCLWFLFGAFRSQEDDIREVIRALLEAAGYTLPIAESAQGL